jgi:hypothetical protein
MKRLRAKGFGTQFELHPEVSDGQWSIAKHDQVYFRNQPGETEYTRVPLDGEIEFWQSLGGDVPPNPMVRVTKVSDVMQSRVLVSGMPQLITSLHPEMLPLNELAMDTDREYFERRPQARQYYRKPLDGELDILKSVGSTNPPKKVKVTQVKRGVRVRDLGEFLAVDEDYDQ